MCHCGMGRGGPGLLQRSVIEIHCLPVWWFCLHIWCFHGFGRAAVCNSAIRAVHNFHCHSRTLSLLYPSNVMFHGSCSSALINSTTRPGLVRCQHRLYIPLHKPTLHRTANQGLSSNGLRPAVRVEQGYITSHRGCGCRYRSRGTGVQVWVDVSSGRVKIWMAWIWGRQLGWPSVQSCGSC